jgi:hypothetical protein
MMEQKFLDNIWKYEEDKLWKMCKRSKKWINFDDNKPNGTGYIPILV